MNLDLSLPPFRNGAFYVDNSSIKNFYSCPWAYRGNQVLQRVTSRPRVGIMFGDAIHKALEHAYKTDPTLANPGTLHEANEVFANRMATFADYPSDDYRNLDYGYDLFEKYFNKYTNETFTIPASPAGKPLVEVSLCMPFTNYIWSDPCFTDPDVVIPVYYAGKVDLVVREGLDFWIMDHKTSSVFGDQLFAEMAVAPQQDGYGWAFKEAAGGLPTGYIINAIATRKPTKTGKGIEFQRQRVYFDQARIDEWVSNTRALVTHMLDVITTGKYPRYRHNCVGKYGRCEFYDVCSLPAEQRETFIMSGNFKHNDWSPLQEVE